MYFTNSEAIKEHSKQLMNLIIQIFLKLSEKNLKAFRTLMLSF